MEHDGARETETAIAHACMRVLIYLFRLHAMLHHTLDQCGCATSICDKDNNECQCLFKLISNKFP